MIKLPKRAIVLGKLMVTVNPDEPSDVDYIEICLNKQPILKIQSPPFEWVWENKVFNKNNLQVIVYDDSGSAKELILISGNSSEKI